MKLKELLSEERQLKEDLESQLHTLQQELSTLKDYGRTKLQAFEIDKSELESTIEDLNNQLAEKVQENQRLQEKVERLQRNIEMSQTQNGERVNQIIIEKDEEIDF